ncbi:MAG: hypothetical protein HQ509_10455 [Candidatus Marinimicrobia bacterium]|nr:hypothetical protein [Candidatus Neomarinimicrobiota bacterium]
MECFYLNQLDITDILMTIATVIMAIIAYLLWRIESNNQKLAMWPHIQELMEAHAKLLVRVIEAQKSEEKPTIDMFTEFTSKVQFFIMYYGEKDELFIKLKETYRKYSDYMLFIADKTTVDAPTLNELYKLNTDISVIIKKRYSFSENK